MTRYLQVRPRPPLDCFVDCLWLQGPSIPLTRLPNGSSNKSAAATAAGPGSAPKLERVLPTGTVEIVIHLAEPEIRLWDKNQLDRHDRFSGAIVAGAHSEIFVIDAKEQEHVLGVHFRPGGAFPFLGVDVHELADKHIDLEGVWGPAATQLRERLLEESRPRHQFEIVEQALLDHAFRTLEHHPAVASALHRLEGQKDGVEPVAQLAREGGLSARRFLELFRREVGLTPKRFCRVLRFQRALDQVEALVESQRLDWIDVALASGYSDQSHFNRDFRAFTGVTPGHYIVSRGESRNHLPV